MQIEDIDNESIPKEEKSDLDKLSNEQTVPHAAPDGLLMDYEKLAETGGTEQDLQHAKPTVGLMGGQPKDDETGLDISQYTGPTSKSSNQFKDPNAPYHTGPANNDEEGH